jgi:putative glutamine amidotransferase
MKPLIGITPDFSAGDRSPFKAKEPTAFLRARYIRAVESQGGLPMILPILSGTTLQRRSAIQALLERIDGLLITGSGPDLDPALYGERARLPLRIMRPERAEFELALARSALKRQIPILGICGGMQLLNVAFGGTLIQDIGREVAPSLEHRQKEKGSDLTHWVRIERATRLYRIFRRDTLKTNSFHHQAIREIAPGFRVSARSNDGIIEAIEKEDGSFVLGVQWHPEYLYPRQAEAARLFKAFLSAALKRSP